jgi:hypothetical protein
MNRGLPDRRIDVMEAVLATLERLRETERKGKVLWLPRIGKVTSGATVPACD